MAIRHITSITNVDADGYLIEATVAHHGTIRAAQVEDLGGPVDPLTHLNLDFRDHDLGECAVAERLEKGAPIVIDADGHFLRAIPRPSARRRLGKVDVGGRRTAWLEAFHPQPEGASSVRS